MNVETLRYMREMARELGRMALGQGAVSLACIFGMAELEAGDQIVERTHDSAQLGRRRSA